MKEGFNVYVNNGKIAVNFRSKTREFSLEEIDKMYSVVPLMSRLRVSEWAPALRDMNSKEVLGILRMWRIIIHGYNPLEERHVSKRKN